LMKKCRIEVPLSAPLARQTATALVLALQTPGLAPWVLPAAGGAVAQVVAELGPMKAQMVSDRRPLVGQCLQEQHERISRSA